MPYLIDSDWVIDHLASVPEATALFNELSDLDRIAISIVTYMESTRTFCPAAIRGVCGCRPRSPLLLRRGNTRRSGAA